VECGKTRAPDATQHPSGSKARLWSNFGNGWPLSEIETGAGELWILEVLRAAQFGIWSTATKYEKAPGVCRRFME
jgi:hypothetical protein